MNHLCLMSCQFVPIVISEQFVFMFVCVNMMFGPFVCIVFIVMSLFQHACDEEN
jgi:hypothetical protein